jgi:16S rRNA (cytosine1402-N4)-methyltransferase
LEKTLPQALKLVRPGGRIAVVSYHSLEDRIVKRLFHLWRENNFGKFVTRSPLRPEREEILRNNRAKAAKLRVVEKL